MPVGTEAFKGLGYINDRKTDGINAVDGSIAHSLSIVEKHHHRYNRWFGRAAVPSPGINEGDLVDSGGLNPYRIDAGAGAYGLWFPLLGTDDTTIGEFAAEKYCDAHRLFIWAAQSINGYFLQIAHSDIDEADALSKGQYTIELFKPQSAVGRQDPVEINLGRPPTGHKVWARGWAVGAVVVQYLDFFLSLHFYANGV